MFDCVYKRSNVSKKMNCVCEHLGGSCIISNGSQKSSNHEMLLPCIEDTRRGQRHRASLGISPSTFNVLVSQISGPLEKKSVGKEGGIAKIRSGSRPCIELPGLVFFKEKPVLAF